MFKVSVHRVIDSSARVRQGLSERWGEQVMIMIASVQD